MFYLFDELLTALMGNMSAYAWYSDVKNIILIICSFLLPYLAYQLLKAFFSMGWLKW